MEVGSRRAIARWMRRRYPEEADLRSASFRLHESGAPRARLPEEGGEAIIAVTGAGIPHS